MTETALMDWDVKFSITDPIHSSLLSELQQPVMANEVCDYDDDALRLPRYCVLLY